MAKTVIIGLFVFVVAAFTVMALGANGREAEAGAPLCFDGLDDDGNTLTDADDPLCAGVTATPSPSPSPTASPTPSPSPTPSGTAAATGTGTATPTPTRLPAAAPQTGGDTGAGGSDTLTLALGAIATIIGAAGVFAGKYALDRRK
jgi:hypothetical protein